MAAISVLGDLIQTISDRGRDLIGLSRGDLARTASPADLARLCEDLISRRGEASGVALARLILDRYASLPLEERLIFLGIVASEFGADHAAVEQAIAGYRADPTRARLGLLHEAAEAARWRWCGCARISSSCASISRIRAPTRRWWMRR